MKNLIKSLITITFVLGTCLVSFGQMQNQDVQEVQAQETEYGVYAYLINPSPPYWPSEYGWHPCYIQYVRQERPNRFDDDARYVMVRVTNSESAASNYISLFSMYHDDEPDGVVKLVSCEAAKEARNYGDVSSHQVKSAKSNCPDCANGKWEGRWTPSLEQHMEWGVYLFTKYTFNEAVSMMKKEIKIRQDCIDNCAKYITKVFNNPQVEPGYYLDGCLTWASNCGKPAADYFCRWKGFDESVDRKHQKNSPPTMTVKSREKCEDKFCGRLVMVKCRKKDK